ncbi:aminotransferase class I/II-fold pyridoxal phosphate-dependent enzyme [Streptomyces sp. NPDC052077]|uniref:aminotransferase class I/II-fold pyridoxal phosphate-dependent enzyme n=1 Tax=Streptomyces sp. NPDC052077 TaxID=3154757 RepID=UPI00341D7907
MTRRRPKAAALAATAFGFRERSVNETDSDSEYTILTLRLYSDCTLISMRQSAGKQVGERGVGWVTGTPALVTAVRSAKQYLTFVASGPFQYAVAEALALPDAYFTDLREDLRTKRDLLVTGLTEAGFGVFRPMGTYFVTTDIRPLGESDGFAFCRALPERAGVVAIPNAVFYDHREAGAPFVRFAFCKRTEILEEAVTRLKRLSS